MGSLYRSRPMALCQLFVQVDSAFESIAALGESGVCQFRDLNAGISSYQRKYVAEVKRCDEMERKIRFVLKVLEDHGMESADVKEYPSSPHPQDMNELDANLERLEEEIIKMNGSVHALRQNYEQISDVRHVLLQLQVLFQEDQRHHAFQSISEAESGFGPIELHSSSGNAPLIEHTGRDKPRADSILPIIPRPNELKFLAGIIPSERVAGFERVLWRMCHGKVFMRAHDIELDAYSPFRDEQKKSAFILFFAGDSISLKVKRICDSFRASLVENCPESGHGRAEMLRNVVAKLADLGMVIGKTLEHQHRVLQLAALKIKEWELQVLQLKSIFHTLNLLSLDVTHKCLIAECWIPAEEVPRVRRALHHATEVSGSDVPSVLNRLEEGRGTPPTYHRLNKFTTAFQGIVDAYGIANYREINPAPWTIITFPFLFAVMFGDSGHGLIMALAALAFVLFEKRIEAAKIRDEIFNTFYGGRYVILLMGLFAIYTGAIYNDVFSKSINAFGSHWRSPFNETQLELWIEQGERENRTILIELAPAESFLHDQGPYPFGLDPVWNLAVNRLNFVNPMKMKASVIMGVSQMFFGVVLSLFNHLHFNAHLDILFVFIPQLLFLTLIFVYLCAQIVTKWLFFWVSSGTVLGQQYPGAACAPSLLVGLINMFMMKSREQGFVQENPETHKTELINQCYLQYWYPYQGEVEKAFMLVALLCIPVMLLVKPLVLLFRVRRGEHVAVHGHGEGDHQEFNFGDVFVYQAIHTIEFALGCISHTASYLRLWALSLAHAQLSDVLWSMVLREALAMGGWAGAGASFVVFWAFGVLSVAILVLMEGLSAFLHALRLHWVEFQSKFYGGSGVPFEPFSFRKIIRKHEGLED